MFMHFACQSCALSKIAASAFSAATYCVLLPTYSSFVTPTKYELLYAFHIYNFLSIILLSYITKVPLTGLLHLEGRKGLPDHVTTVTDCHNGHMIWT